MSTPSCSSSARNVAVVDPKRCGAGHHLGRVAIVRADRVGRNDGVVGNRDVAVVLAPSTRWPKHTARRATQPWNLFLTLIEESPLRSMFQAVLGEGDPGRLVQPVAGVLN